MALGIASIPLTLLGFYATGPMAIILVAGGVAAAVCAVALGSEGLRNDYPHRAMAIAGIVTGGITLAGLAVLLLLFLIILIAFL